MIYMMVRDWVDDRWRAPGLQAKVLLLPAMMPGLLLFPFHQTLLAHALTWIWFTLWTSFVAWRYWLYMTEVSAVADEHYDRKGKFKLAREYHETESATAIRKRKKKQHG